MEKVLDRVYNQNVVFYNPANIPEVERFFKVCTDLKRNGGNLRVLIDQSGYFARISNGPFKEIKDLSQIEAFCKKYEKLNIILSPVKFERMFEISSGDMLAVVDGGAKVSEFAEAARREGLFFPSGTTLFDNITIAQMIDDGFISDIESSYGRLREYILSLDIITPSGEKISSGSHSVKDVTGYNITGFVYGTHGRCGLVSKVVTKLTPIYKHTKMICYGGRLEDLERISSRINLEVGSVNQTIYFVESLVNVNEAEKVEYVTGERGISRLKKYSEKTDVEAVLTVRLESGSEEALGYAEDSIEKIVLSKGVKTENVFECELTGRNILEGLFKNKDEYSAAVHVSFYPKAGAEYPIRGIAWESLNPKRIHYILPCGEETRFCDLKKTEIGRFLAKRDLNFTGLKIESIAHMGEGLEKLPVDDEKLLNYIFLKEDIEDVRIYEILKNPGFPFYGDSSGDNSVELLSSGKSDKKSGEAVRNLNSRLLRLFDPERIIG